MSPYTLMGWMSLAVLAAVVGPYLFRTRRKGSAARERFFRDGGTIGFVGPATVPLRGERVIGKHPALGMGYPPAREKRPRKPSIFLTPRQLERINLYRLSWDQPALNRDGFTNAVAHAWDQPRRQPENVYEWVIYLILYRVLTTDHTTSRAYVGTGLTITPDAPYNGHGGELPGAGADGPWTAPNAQAALVAFAIGHRCYSDGYPDSRDKYQPGDHVGGYGATGLNPYKQAPGAGQFDDGGGPASAGPDLDPRY